MRLPNPLSFVSVNLYEKCLQTEKFSKERERPKRDLFNISVELGRCPSATMTLFLASQSMRLPDSSTSTLSGSDQDSQVMNLPHHLIEFLRGNYDGSALSSISTSSLQFSDFCRISENAIIDGSRSDHKTSVIFTELKPFSPSEMRVLLIIMVDRIGSTFNKRGRHVAADTRLAVGDSDRLRRPLAVACIDITKDILPILLPFCTPSRPFDRQSRKPSFSRIVPLRSSFESSHGDVLIKLANDTRSSVWDLIPSSGVAKFDVVTSASVLPPSYPSSQSGSFNAELSEDLDVEIKDVKTITLQPYHLIRRSYMESIIARPYGIIEGNFSNIETIRNDFFVTLKSASFDKTTRKEYNVEVEVSLRDPQGRPFPWIESAGDSQYVSSISASKSQPRWNELIRFAIPWSLDCPKLDYPDDRFTRLDNIMDSSTVTEDHIEPVISTSSSLCSSRDSGTFARKTPVSAHIRFVVKHRSTTSEPRDKVLGVAFLPLGSVDEQTFLKDGDYSLFIHKMDEQEIAECEYLNKEAVAFIGAGSINSSGSSGGNKSSGLGKVENGGSHGSMAAPLLNLVTSSFTGRGNKQPDTLNITTLLCSNQYTTDEHLAKILAWRENMEDAVFCLKLLITHAEKESELKKFRIQLIDALLQILSSKDTAESSVHMQELNCFTVALLARIYRELNNNVAASELLEKYLQSPTFTYSRLHLNYLQVFIDLLSRYLPLTQQINSSTVSQLPERDNIGAGKICTTFSWAFKIIAKSRELEIKRLNAESPGLASRMEKEFINTVDKFFEIVLEVAAIGVDQLLKSHIFKHISEVIDPLARVYPRSSLAKYLERLVQRTIQCPNLPNHNILSGCLRSVLMEDTDCRRILVPPIITNLKKLFTNNLDITLEPCRSETNSMMAYFCNILTLFMQRFVETVLASTSTCTSTPLEFHEQFVTQGLLRWVMREYGRILISLQRTASSVPNSRPASSELTPTSGQTLLGVQSPAKARFLYLQPVLGCLASVFTSILQQLQSSDWEALLNPRGQPRLNCLCATCVGLEFTDTVDFLHELFHIFLLSHSWPAYPGLHGNNRLFKYHNLPTHLVTPLSTESIREQPWVEMLALQSTVELKTMRVIFEECLQPFFMSNASGRLDASHPKTRLLVKSLQCCLGSFITAQPHLWLEELPTVTMVATAPRLPNGCLGDLRVFAGRLLEELWRAIGQSHQSQYMEFFIPTAMNASTEPVSELRKICVKMLMDMLQVNPLAAEPFLIREVDRVMNWALPEFSTEMLALLEAEVPDGAIENLSRKTSFALRRGAPVKPSPSNLALTASKLKIRILNDLIRQINYLWDYSEVITRRSKLSGMLAINNLRTYYDSIKRKDMTIRYLFKLEELHEQSENDIERGYTLERISGQYSWSSNPVDISEVSEHYVHLGNISSSAVKEALLLDALKYLKDGGDWKRAIEVCDQLIVFYRDVTADLANLSKILAEQSQLYDKFISGDIRNQCCYKYYALHFTTRQDSPGFIENTLVYRTLSQLNEVKMTLCEQFPEYHVETNNPQPLTSTRTQVTNDVPTIRLVGNLHPVPELPPNWASGEAAANLSPHIKAYYKWNQVRQFTRTYHYKPTKSADGKEMPVVEEIRYTISDKLPNIVSFMPVEKITPRTLSYVEYVINTVQDNCQSLSANIEDINSSSNPGSLLSNFIGKLSTSIHSPVSGGLTTLLTNVNLVDDSVDEGQSEQLSDAVFHLLEVQAEGLMLCKNLEASPEVSGSIANLLPTMIEQYYSLIHEMSMKFGISVSKLKEKMQLASPTQTTTGLPIGGSAPSLQQADRVYRRATQVPNIAQSIRPRTSFQQDLSFLSDDGLDSPVSPTPVDQRKLSAPLVSQTPPPLPERPSDLPPLNGNATMSGRSHKLSFSDAYSTPFSYRHGLPPVASNSSIASGTFTPRRPAYPLPPEPDVLPPAASPGDEVPPPLPKKPPKLPPRIVKIREYHGSSNSVPFSEVKPSLDASIREICLFAEKGLLYSSFLSRNLRIVRDEARCSSQGGPTLGYLLLGSPTRTRFHFLVV
ncbi:hypothetical protein Aperf_G00000069012 [Anoplocephala perfoliata]